MLEELFATPITCRMIEHVIARENGEFNYKDMTDELGVSAPSIYTAFDTCKKFELIVETRRIARSVLYKRNEKSQLIPILQTLLFSMKKTRGEMNG